MQYLSEEKQSHPAGNGIRGALLERRVVRESLSEEVMVVMRRIQLPEEHSSTVNLRSKALRWERAEYPEV